jgi:hypothetical protein
MGSRLLAQFVNYTAGIGQPLNVSRHSSKTRRYGDYSLPGGPRFRMLEAWIILVDEDKWDLRQSGILRPAVEYLEPSKLRKSQRWVAVGGTRSDGRIDAGWRRRAS